MTGCYFLCSITSPVSQPIDDALNAGPGIGLPRELSYLILLFALFVAPKWLQRYRIPAAVTSLALGVGATFGGWFVGDPTVQLLASFGAWTQRTLPAAR